MVPQERFELSRCEALVPKTSVSTVPPPGQDESLPLTLACLLSDKPNWCWLRDSNSRPEVYKTPALPTELNQHELFTRKFGAGKENRTPILSLEGCDNTIILYPHGGETGIRTLGTGEGTTS